MPGLWRFNTGEEKYLVLRRDGTKPAWPHFVLGARDPVAPEALRAYSAAAEKLGMDEVYCNDILVLAELFEEFLVEHNEGDPDAPKHRLDNEHVVWMMENGEQGLAGLLANLDVKHEETDDGVVS
jgi:hypothetical protein